MFEKEASEYTDKRIIPIQQVSETDLYNAFKDGAEFGYNKANEWHYVKDGDLPKEDNKIVLCVDINGYIESKPNYVYKLLTKNDFPFTHGLVAWCEIPKYEED